MGFEIEPADLRTSCCEGRVPRMNFKNRITDLGSI